ncbi:MAG: YeeE/YedE thiosulfate transporter family protein [Polaromonas sp.]
MLTLFLGMLASSLRRGTFQLRGWKAMQCWRSMLGGLFMGLGSALIPGGNGTVILVLIPTLSLQALVGFLSMLAGIALILMRLHR